MDADADPLSLSLHSLFYAAAIVPEPTVVLMMVVLVLLLLVSAIISGSEVALFSLDGSAKETLAEAEDRASRRVLALLEKPHPLLITILLLNTFVNVSAAILAALITERMASGLALSQTLVFILEVIVLTFVLLVISEITPKLIATRHATTYSRIVSAPLIVLHKLLRPISSVLAWAMRFVQSRFKPRPPPLLSSEDIKAMAEIGEAHGTFEEEERELIHSIVEFGDTSARAIMINRRDRPLVRMISMALVHASDAALSYRWM